MKIINNLFILSSVLFIMLLSACDTDQEGTIYNNTEQKVSFVLSQLPDQTLSKDDPTFTVDIYRTNTKGELKGSITVQVFNDAGEPVTTVKPVVSNYDFKEGEGRTTVTVDMSSLPAGEAVIVALSLAKDAVNDLSNATTEVVVERADK